MTAAHTLQIGSAQQREQARALYRLDELALDRLEVRQAQGLFGLFEGRRADGISESLETFGAWLCEGWAKPLSVGTLYRRYAQGRALAEGHPDTLPLGDLNAIGRRYLAGWDRAQVETAIKHGGMEAIHAANRKQAATEPTLDGERIRAQQAVRAAAGRDGPTHSEEAEKLALQVVQVLPESILASAVRVTQTGEAFEDAARSVVAEMMSPRKWLSQQSCSVPSCGAPSAELHHVRLPNQRYRSTEILLPLCARHHGAQVGHTSEAAHAHRQDDWVERFWPDQTAFWRDLASLYSEFLEQFREESS